MQGNIKIFHHSKLNLSIFWKKVAKIKWFKLCVNEVRVVKAASNLFMHNMEGSDWLRALSLFKIPPPPVMK